MRQGSWPVVRGPPRSHERPFARSWSPERRSDLARSWFGFQVWLGLAGAGGPCFQELGEGGWLTGLPVAELVDHDHELRAVRPVVGEREVVGVCHLAHVLVARPRVRDVRTVGFAAPPGFAGCPAGFGHWPASLSAA